MSIKIVEDTKLTAIGNAIRTKGGTSALIDIDDMPQAIADLPSGGTDTAAPLMSDVNIGSYYNEDITSLCDCALFYRRSITELELPNCEQIGNGTSNSPGCAVQACTSLQRLVLPKLKTIIGNYNFANNSYLAFVDFGDAPLTGFGSGYAFSFCIRLTTLILRRSDDIVPLNNTNHFNRSNLDYDAYIYVPRNLLSNYQNATNWSTYSSHFRAIEDYPNVCG